MEREKEMVSKAMEMKEAIASEVAVKRAKRLEEEEEDRQLDLFLMNNKELFDL
jgi:hypothetical protein